MRGLTILLLGLFVTSAGADASWNWDGCCFWFGGKKGVGAPRWPPCETAERAVTDRGACSAVGIVHDGDRAVVHITGWTQQADTAPLGRNMPEDERPIMYTLLGLFCAIQATYGPGYVIWPDGEDTLCHGVG